MAAIAKGIYYFKSDTDVYLRNVDNQKDYLLTASAYDILECIKSGRADSAETLTNCMEEIYDLADGDRESITEFYDYLLSEGILESEASESVNVSDIVEERYSEKRKIYSAALELTYRCNERCVHCYVKGREKPSAEGELEYADYVKILDELYSLGCVRLLITGGESTLHGDFLKITEYAVKKGFLVDVYTNGLHMPDDTFEKLKSLKLNSVSVSLYGGTAEVHDAVTGIKGSFEKTLKTVMMFKCAGVDCYIKSVIIKENFSDIENLYRLGERLNIEVKPTMYIGPKKDGEASECLLGEYEKYRAAVKLIDTRSDEMTGGVSQGVDGAMCRAGYSMIAIDPRGNVYPCISVKRLLGNIRESNIKDIWEGSKILEEIRSVTKRTVSSKCEACKYIGSCFVCMGDAMKENGGEIAPCRDTCIMAQAVYDTRKVTGGET